MRINNLRQLAQRENWLLFILSGAINKLKHIGHSYFQAEEYTIVVLQLVRAVEFLGKAYTSLQKVQKDRMEKRKKK